MGSLQSRPEASDAPRERPPTPTGDGQLQPNHAPRPPLTSFDPTQLHLLGAADAEELPPTITTPCRPEQDMSAVATPGRLLARRRNGEGSADKNAPRSNSNISSTSSDILVAGAPPSTTRRRKNGPMSFVDRTSPERGTVLASMTNRRHLMVKALGPTRRHQLERIVSAPPSRMAAPNSFGSIYDLSAIKREADGNESDGPNRRGTYSKEYTSKHPEIEWVHRGQGRYLPANEARSSKAPSSAPPKPRDPMLGDISNPLQTPTNAPHAPHTRRSTGSTFRSETQDVNAEDDPDDPDSESAPRDRTSSLRKRGGEAQTPSSAEQRSVRLARRAKPEASLDLERRSSRFSTSHPNYQEDESESAGETDMESNDKEETFREEYTLAHPEQQFHHTGNGWYKRGPKPRGRKRAKDRESAVGVRRNGKWEFDKGDTVHESKVQLYQGAEFHHSGNGWYKPGPDTTGRRESFVVEGSDDGRAPNVAGKSEEGDLDEHGTMGRSHGAANDGVPMGKGRYKPKHPAQEDIPELQPEAAPEASPTSQIFTKQYVAARPGQKFHHRGNARYKRGPPPIKWKEDRLKRKNALAGEDHADETPEEPEPNKLYSKEFKDAHPHITFHHRGQGRYAVGPFKKASTPEEPVTEAQSSEQETESDMAGDADGLVDTDYVDARPEKTFHHRGQGRWARGLPPPGSSNKMAVRGPGARERGETVRPSEEQEQEQEPESERNLPPLEALLHKSESKELFPNINWHYRGGGKWSRLTKEQAEERAGKVKKLPARRRTARMSAKTLDGPGAQLAKETNTTYTDDGDDGEGDGLEGPSSPARPVMQRRHNTKRRSVLPADDGLASKQSSQSHSQAPTPKPRMLEPWEDILTEADFPQIIAYPSDYDSENEPEIDWDSPDAEAAFDRRYPPPKNLEAFIESMTKHDPAVRSTQNLLRLTEHGARMMQMVQDEYLALEAITAPNARVPRKLARGGRPPVDSLTFEDKKEADLYDYTYDARRPGFQDPEAQKIQRDAEGREIRGGRRNRSSAIVANNGTVPGWNFGDDDALGSKRAVKPVTRFDGIVEPPRKRARGSAAPSEHGTYTPSANPYAVPGMVVGGATPSIVSNASLPPSRAVTPLGGPTLPGSYVPAASGRWAGHVPKRIRELRGESVGGASGKGDSPKGESTNTDAGAKNDSITAANNTSPTPSTGTTAAPAGSTARKGRPPGSKNLHKRKDAGIKKGPRKSRVVDSIEGEGAAPSDAAGAPSEGPAAAISRNTQPRASGNPTTGQLDGGAAFPPAPRDPYNYDNRGYDVYARPPHPHHPRHPLHHAPQGPPPVRIVRLTAHDGRPSNVPEPFYDNTGRAVDPSSRPVRLLDPVYDGYGNTVGIWDEGGAILWRGQAEEGRGW